MSACRAFIWHSSLRVWFSATAMCYIISNLYIYCNYMIRISCYVHLLYTSMCHTLCILYACFYAHHVCMQHFMVFSCDQAALRTLPSIPMSICSSVSWVSLLADVPLGDDLLYILAQTFMSQLTVQQSLGVVTRQSCKLMGLWDWELMSHPDPMVLPVGTLHPLEWPEGQGQRSKGSKPNVAISGR